MWLKNFHQDKAPATYILIIVILHRATVKAEIQKTRAGH